MAVVVGVWELGEDLGHITGMREYLHEMVRRGHDVYFILKDMSRLNSVNFSDDVKVIQAPLMRGKRLPAGSQCFADILQSVGYFEPGQLKTSLTAWQQLYALITPDVILFDHAPTAMIAARPLPIPKFIISGAYYTPAPGMPDVQLKPGVDAGHIESSEQRQVETINRLLSERGGESIQYVSDIFQSELTVLKGFSGLDPFSEGRRNALYEGSNPRGMDLADAQWGGSRHPKIFAYLKHGKPHVNTVISMLTECPVNVLCYYAGGEPGSLREFESDHFRIIDRPVDIRSALTTAQGLVCHAGVGTVMESIEARVPVLGLPTQLEQNHNASFLEQHASGVCVASKDEVSVVADKVLRFVDAINREKSASSLRLLQQVKHESRRDLVEHVCNRAEQLIGM